MMFIRGGMAMANRYIKIIDHLDQKREEDLKICNARSCACKGCCGVVGSKRITKQELDLYLSGDMQKVVDGGN